jgi:hypothetical protein
MCDQSPVQETAARSDVQQKALAGRRDATCCGAWRSVAMLLFIMSSGLPGLFADAPAFRRPWRSGIAMLATRVRLGS